MPYADFCRRVRMICITLSHAFVTYDRSPEVSSTAFRASPPNLRFTLLMDRGFAKPSPLARRSRLISGFCSSARIFAPRFFQTLRRRNALALRYDCRVGPGISLRASHRSGREPLDSSGSCHPKKAAAFHQDKEFLRFPVDSTPTWMACPLRSTGITPLLRYYEAVRP